MRCRSMKPLHRLGDAPQRSVGGSASLGQTCSPAAGAGAAAAVHRIGTLPPFSLTFLYMTYL